MLSEAAALSRAKDNYQHALRQIDQTLMNTVSKDPSLLEEAEALQAEFSKIEYSPAPLTRELTQPSE